MWDAPGSSKVGFDGVRSPGTTGKHEIAISCAENRSGSGITTAWDWQSLPRSTGSEPAAGRAPWANLVKGGILSWNTPDTTKLILTKILKN